MKRQKWQETKNEVKVNEHMLRPEKRKTFPILLFLLKEKY